MTERERTHAVQLTPDEARELWRAARFGGPGDAAIGIPLKSAMEKLAAFERRFTPRAARPAIGQEHTPASPGSSGQREAPREQDRERGGGGGTTRV